MKKKKKKQVQKNQAPKNKGGRPKKYDDPDEFAQIIDAYFDECDSKGKVYTFSGLALALNMDVKSVRNYGKDEKFFPSVNRARLKIMEQYEQELFRTQGSTQGVQFALKIIASDNVEKPN